MPGTGPAAALLVSSAAVKLAPWEYLLIPFDKPAQGSPGFPDLYDPIWGAALVLLIVQVVMYNVRTRTLHRHEPLVTLQEWLLWTGLAVFGLLLVESIFHFYFLFVVLTLVLGLATYVWVRFIRFPPLIRAYNNQLRRARSFSQQRYRSPETTVRRRTQGNRRRRR